MILELDELMDDSGRLCFALNISIIFCLGCLWVHWSDALEYSVYNPRNIHFRMQVSAETLQFDSTSFNIQRFVN